MTKELYSKLFEEWYARQEPDAQTKMILESGFTSVSWDANKEEIKIAFIAGCEIIKDIEND